MGSSEEALASAQAGTVVLTSKVLEFCAGQQRVQGMAKLMEQRLGLVGAHQAPLERPKLHTRATTGSW